MKIVNLTDLDFRRLLVLYSKELSAFKEQDIELLVFGHMRLDIWTTNGLVTVKD